ncbi:tyrosine-type recombinase/integrase [Halobacillus litoralis]|uniref:tyrosine-type recombinase/integrase n=1 Tax=Halobacillus litoralis TaxID=45668 RepID=UPI0019258669|nr:tyrosine-type recombinase/integrase [Halobacillus litoralis]
MQIYKKWCKKTKLSFGLRFKKEDHIFISYQTGKPITDALRRVTDTTGIKPITPHGLRHTHTTLLISKGGSVKVIAERLGNTPQMILDI